MKFSQLKFLTDENISPKITAFLRDQGCSVLDAKENNWYGRDDTFILARSSSEKCFVITHDADFGMLAVNGREPFYGIIYLRLKNLKTENTLRIFKEVFDLELEIEERTIIVVGEKKIRIRKV